MKNNFFKGKTMFNVMIGALLGIIGVAMLTMQFGWGENYAIFRFLLPIAVILIGLWLVLREQGRMAMHSVKKQESTKDTSQEENQPADGPSVDPSL
jgi:hypothetical protein